MINFSEVLNKLKNEIHFRREHSADGYHHLLFIELELTKIIDDMVLQEQGLTETLNKLIEKCQPDLDIFQEFLYGK